MAKFTCCSALIGRSNKNKIDKVSSKHADFNKALKALKIRLEHPVKPFEGNDLKTTSFSVSIPIGIQSNSLNVKVMSNENLKLDNHVKDEPTEVAYEGEDEHEENASMKKELSDLDLQSRVVASGEEGFTPRSARLGSSNSLKISEAEKFNEKGIFEIQSGHVSDPGMGKVAELCGSPKLKRSCSNLETNKVLTKIADHLSHDKSQYCGEFQGPQEKLMEPGSPASVRSHFSADRVMLKKHSSSQVLPSRSRRLWWKLFLWNHRNLHQLWTVKPQLQPGSNDLNQQGGYTSDTLEPNQDLGKMQSPGSFTGESWNKGNNNNEDENQSWDGFHGQASRMWPQNHWVAFSVESSPLGRVEEWVKDLETRPPLPDDDDCNKYGNNDEDITFPPSPEASRSAARSLVHLGRRHDVNLSEETLQANSVIQSLGSASTVAHISSIGLKAIPNISYFSSLRSVNLSNNLIGCITPGSLPKGLHTINLSKNKISSIEGLRELTHLRVLDLSYNRITRIGQGLSNCTIIKELYLAGNKISDVEGLHRLLKLTVLDLSFNKITTTKALGQLVANYNSLQALNLLGNPIQSNIHDDQLRKAVCSLLPKLVYLNKQPIKPQMARDVLTDGVAKAALGTSSWSARKRAAKRVSSIGSASSVHRSSVAAGHKSRSRSKSQTRHVKTTSAGTRCASSSRQ